MKHIIVFAIAVCLLAGFAIAPALPRHKIMLPEQRSPSIST